MSPRAIADAEARLDQRVSAARRTLDAAHDARERNHSLATAQAVAIARQHFEDAVRARARADVVFA